MKEVDAVTRPEHHGNRHGRSEQARRSILEAADNLLVEVGYAKLTMEGIAQRAGVAKQTIYRWWSSKNDVLMDAFTEDFAQSFTSAGSGDLRADLRRHAVQLAEFMTDSDAGAVFRALVAQAQHDPDLAERLRAEHLPRQRHQDRLPFERAVARGEIGPEADLDLAVDQLVGPIYYRALVTGEPMPSSFIEALVDAVLGGPAARRGPETRGS